MLCGKKAYKKFDLMMSVIELLKVNTGYIFRIYVQDINGECRLLINKKDLNRRKILALLQIINIDEDSEMIDITNYFLENCFNSSNVKLEIKDNLILICNELDTYQA